MVVVIIALTIGSLLSIAALSAATGDFPSARTSQDRKTAYAAAESGLAYFNFRLNQNNVYWKTCGDSNSGRVPQTGSKVVPDSSQRYVIEFLPANGAPKCDQSQPDATMIDRTSATFRIRVTGRAGNVYRSIIATYHRKSFLDYLWYTTSEAGDPAIFGGSSTTECLKPRAQRSGCTEITFAEDDELKGPMHTDDTYLVCNDPLFGRNPSLYTFPVNDTIESSGPAPGYKQSCSGQPRIYGTLLSGVTTMPMPSTNSGLATVAAPPNGYTFTGRIRVRLDGGQMDVWQQDDNGNDTTQLVDDGWPSNGVIYVKSGACTTNPSPKTTSYDEDAGCANVYVSGTYSRDLTIAAANDIIVAPPSRSSDDGDLNRAANASLGLIAERYVRVWHPVNTSGWGGYVNTPPVQDDVKIDAAIMSVQHSFMVDNYDKGQSLGKLTVNGAIAQKFRGAVATTGGSGYTKDYNYDDRFHYLNPPSFLDPLTEAWSVKRSNEQVPAAKPTGL